MEPSAQEGMAAHETEDRQGQFSPMDTPTQVPSSQVCSQEDPEQAGGLENGYNGHAGGLAPVGEGDNYHTPLHPGQLGMYSSRLQGHSPLPNNTPVSVASRFRPGFGNGPFAMRTPAENQYPWQPNPW
jgi:hypothetical protein